MLVGSALLRQTVQVFPVTVDFDGRTAGAPVTVRCRIEKTRRLLPANGGNTWQPVHVLYVRPGTILRENAEVKIGATVRATVREIDTEVDGLGRVVMVRAVCW